jgi:hypothetical protein
MFHTNRCWRSHGQWYFDLLLLPLPPSVGHRAPCVIQAHPLGWGNCGRYKAVTVDAYPLLSFLATYIHPPASVSSEEFEGYTELHTNIRDLA